MRDLNIGLLGALPDNEYMLVSIFLGLAKYISTQRRRGQVGFWADEKKTLCVKCCRMRAIRDPKPSSYFGEATLRFNKVGGGRHLFELATWPPIVAGCIDH